MNSGSASGFTGYITLTLHSHLPYVVNHGTWPHGLEWLHEAAAETYLPLLQVLEELEQMGTPLKANINLSPVLLEQLSHPVFKAEFTKYVQRKIEAARQDQSQFSKQGDAHLASLAEYWQRFYEQRLAEFEVLGGDILMRFRHFNDSGAVEIITCAATHGYFPLLGTDNSIRAQVRLGVETYKRYFGRPPRGFWLPECGYRPAGEWRPPLFAATPEVQREGVETILAANGIEYFFVDTHLVERSAMFAPYELIAGDVPVALEIETPEPHPSLYHPHYTGQPGPVAGSVAFFPRDPRTGLQVWSGEIGYPGDSVYLEFHKKHWPGGHRYWQVTHPKSDLGDKTPYFPDCARQRTLLHAAHFAQLAAETIRQNTCGNPNTPVLSAPFDAELFGHWWFEGPMWLKHLAQEVSRPESGCRLITCSEYLDQHKPQDFLSLPEGSWGKHGNNHVWLNAENAWTWPHIYEAEEQVKQLAKDPAWRSTTGTQRLAKQMCRELLLLESSDWQFLITTGTARDYADRRFNTHLGAFNQLFAIWRSVRETRDLNQDQLLQLSNLETRDSLFPEISPEMWM